MVGQLRKDMAPHRKYSYKKRRLFQPGLPEHSAPLIRGHHFFDTQDAEHSRQDPEADFQKAQWRCLSPARQVTKLDETAQGQYKRPTTGEARLLQEQEGAAHRYAPNTCMIILEYAS